jgi:hypothetical protein
MIDAEKYLEQVEFIENKIENRLCEKQKWEDLAYKLTSNSGETIAIINNNGKLELHNAEKVQSSGRTDTMAIAVEMCLQEVEKINGIVAELVKVKENVLLTIEKLKSPIEYSVLYKKYFEHLTLQEIADVYGYQYTWATTTHGRAKANLQKILDKGGETMKKIF